MRFRVIKGINFFRAMYSLNEYIDYLKRVEGYDNKVGDKFYPYDSPEGGLKTIGYGYKIKTLEEQNTLEKTGLSSTEVDDILLEEAEHSYQKAKKFCEQKNYNWEATELRLRFALADICFNVGSLKDFPTTTKSLVNNNVAGAIADDPGRTGFKHYERTFRDKHGVRRTLARNKIFYREFLKPYVEE
tara:strand:- start:304 stop:864 length:561 start_codon:yes stop_codon:yes gene_type:complete